MAKDPAFLFYPADASEDTQFMNRLERGCYFDILKAQKRFGKFTLDQIKKVLGSDFESCWPALNLVLKCEEGFYFIEWVAEKIDERKKFSESRRKNRFSKTSKEQVIDKCQTSVEDMVIENEDEIVIKDEKEIENKILLQKNQNGWNSKPLPDDVGDLPDIKMGSTIEYIRLTKGKSVTREVVTGLYTVFKTQNLTGDKFYPSESDIHSHFLNWIKFQNFDNATNHQTSSAPKLGTSAARVEALRNW